jgi:arginyl-tRNA synthetase
MLIGDLLQLPPSPLFLLPVPDGVALRVFFVDKILPRLLLPYIADRGSKYGSSTSIGLSNPADPSSPPKKLLIEFSSPNLAQEFSTRHLRSTSEWAGM